MPSEVKVCKHPTCHRSVESALLEHQEGYCQKRYGINCLLLDMCRSSNCLRHATWNEPLSLKGLCHECAIKK